MKKGFTLVELLAVIVILGLLITIAIPAVLNVSKNVKKKSYETKIQMIENAGISYGESNLKDFFIAQLKKHPTTPRCSTGDNCVVNPWIQIKGDGTIIESSENGEYPARKIYVDDLVSYNELSYDTTDRCGKSKKMNTTTCINNGYNNVITNPITDNIINKCYVYIYYKNNRVYSIFDKKNCDNATSAGTITPGQEYPDQL